MFSSFFPNAFNISSSFGNLELNFSIIFSIILEVSPLSFSFNSSIYFSLNRFAFLGNGSIMEPPAIVTIGE